MPVPRVKIVNENGRVGYVAATYPPLVRGGLRVAPSQAAGLNSGEPVSAVPARNASHEAWVAFASEHGLSSDEAAAMTRDELVAHYSQEA